MNIPASGLPEGLIALVREARSVTVLTGAGVSAESGVPTFRDAQTGLWARYRPEDLATPEAFRRNPQLVWEWYAWRRELVAKAAPNPAHQALVELESRVSRFTLVTQNVDGLHHRAGSRNVIELHGNIGRTKCFREDKPVQSYPDSRTVPPCCPDCGGPLRPDVVWFNEALPADSLQAAYEAARNCDLFFSVGTSSVVHPAGALPCETLERGCPVVEINLEDTPLTPHVTFSIREPAGKCLPALIKAAW